MTDITTTISITLNFDRELTEDEARGVVDSVSLHLDDQQYRAKEEIAAGITGMPNGAVAFADFSYLRASGKNVREAA